MNRQINMILAFFSAIFALASAGFAESPEGRTRSRCNVANLGLVFSDPMRYRGRIFCGTAVGVMDRTGILFFPSEHVPQNINYDTVMFIDDRRVSDSLRITQPGRFT